MTATTLRRRTATAGALLALAVVSSALTGCDTGVHGQDTRNGTQLRPTQIATPPAYTDQVPPGQG
jgi:hypothetical protein